MVVSRRKILYVATVDSHIKNFHLPYLKMMHDYGWKVHVVTNGKEKIPYCDKKYTICMERSPYKINNFKAIKQLRRIINEEGYEIIHCHTPMGSVITRLAARQARKNGTRVIYTAHGFHFYKGAPLLNWFLYYPVEKYLAGYTDTLITINQEDYNRAKNKFRKRCYDIQYVPGAGIDPRKFDFRMSEKEKHDLRSSLGLKDDDFVMIFPARLDKNKNQGFLIKCMPELLSINSKIFLLLPGEDELNGRYQKIAEELKVDKNVLFLGNRDDILKLLRISNLAVSSSKREGLPINILEARLSGLPIIALDCRGMTDSLNGYKSATVIGKENRNDQFKRAIFKDLDENQSVSKDDCSKYFIDNVVQVLKKIYRCENHVAKSNNNRKVSVIIPCFNNHDTIADCIESIEKQTYKNIEIIVCDDSSEDNSVEIITALMKKYNNIKLIQNSQNMKAAYSRNKCIEAAKGYYIAIQDADDLSVASRIEREVAFLDNNPSYSYVAANMSTITDNRNEIMNNYEIQVGKELLDKDFINGLPFAHGSVMIRKGVLEKIGGYTVSPLTVRGQDYELFLRLQSTREKGYKLGDVLYLYREDEQAYKRRKYKYRINECKIRKKYFKKLTLPLIYRLYIYRPLIVGLLPKIVIKRHHERKYK